MKHFIANAFIRTSYLLFLLLGSIFFFSSCEKDAASENNRTDPAPPVIERVRLTDPATADSSLKKATLGSTVVIVGQNLYSARTVSFNGYPITVNPAYATKNTIIVSIPDSVPTIATRPSVPDELKVVNSAGETTYKFIVLPPRPEVEMISNEFAKPGESITLYGKYFFFVDTVTFPGGVKVASGIQTNGSSLTVNVPAGVDLTNGDIIVRSQSGISVTGRKTKFYNPARSAMLIDWDAKNTDGSIKNFGWGLDAGKTVGTNLGFTPVSGAYATINQSVPGNWGWNNDKVINMNNWSGSLFPAAGGANFAANTPLSSIDMKFEVSSLTPVGNLLFQAWQADYTANANLKDFVKSADGKWYTVTINLGDLAKGSSKLATYGDLIKPNEFRLVLQNPTTDDIVTKMAIDNIRLVNNVRN